VDTDTDTGEVQAEGVKHETAKPNQRDRWTPAKCKPKA